MKKGNYNMKKILLTIIITFGFIQAEEWIYYSSSDYYSDNAGVYRTNVDGSENELVMEGVFLRDVSFDESTLLVTNNTSNSVSIVDIETMNVQTMAFADIIPKNLHFSNDENVIIFTDNYFDLYKYSFIDHSLTFIDTGSNTENYKLSMSPNGEKAVFLKDSVQGFFPFEENTVDIVIVDFLTDEVSILQTLSTSEHECLDPFHLMGISYRTYWGADDYIYISICETSESFQFLKIHSIYGYAVQLLENDFFYSLGLKGHDIEKVVFAGFSSTSPYGIFDIETNEASFHENLYVEIEFEDSVLGGDRPISWLYQAWSPDNSKVALNGSVFLGGMIGNDAPVAIHVFDTDAGSITQILPDDFSDNYSVGPVFWVSSGVAGDVNDDGILNISDIVIIVNMIMAGETNSSADYNGDGNVNVVDVVAIVQVILGN